MIRTAVFSECRTWRYALGRTWLTGNGLATFVLLNPSTADAEHDDPTNRRGITFAQRWGFRACCFVNLFAYRATDPGDMLAAQDPVGPANDSAITEMCRDASEVIVAWGNHGSHLGRDEQVMALLVGIGVNPVCLGLTKSGHPRHPLYLRGDTARQPFEISA